MRSAVCFFDSGELNEFTSYNVPVEHIQPRQKRDVRLFHIYIISLKLKFYLVEVFFFKLISDDAKSFYDISTGHKIRCLPPRGILQQRQTK